MNKANLKSYAPKARLDFIKTVTERANVLGISATGTVPAQLRGDVAIIDGREWPAKVAGQRDELIARIKRHGFGQTMDEVAYTWFNRFAALRYMEIHDYLGHGWRVLSSRDGGLPEILRHASEVTLPGLNADRAHEMQLAGNQDNELYKLLLVAQCNELSRVMPFLFERIDDETELLLPENLLRTDSIVAKLVESVPEEDWQEIEVIGWLYQFYISEKKEQVIGKVVKSEDIPAATQLFTPNWIVQYLVQNSVGRLWLIANPTSNLASQWPYYIQPAEQTSEVQGQVDALIQTRIREDGEMMNPETITVLDPACGSGHILVVAYDVLKAIYLERGYQPRAIPRLVLEKNLYGLDIDDRAAQLAAFALLMKARADDRRLFLDPPKLNVLSIQESNGLDVGELASHLAPFGVQRATLKSLVDIFEDAKTFGSLIQVSPVLNGQLAAVLAGLHLALREGDLYAQQSAKDVLPLIFQALILGTSFDAVVANPPYMGNKGLNDSLKSFGRLNFPDSKADIFAMFIERALAMLKESGIASLVTMQSWMFLSSYEALREKLLLNSNLNCLAHFPYENRMPTAMGINFGISAFAVGRRRLKGYSSSFCCAQHHELNEDGKPYSFPPSNARHRNLSLSVLETIPGKPISYWINPGLRNVFDNAVTLESKYPPKTGMTTGDDGRFLRLWHEVDHHKFSSDCDSSLGAKLSGRKWFPYNKGGVGNRWYGHCNVIINWLNDGAEVKDWVVSNPNDPNTTSWSRRVFNHEFFFKPGLTWTLLNSRTFNVRWLARGSVLNVNGPTVSIPSAEQCKYVLGFLNSKVAAALVQVINPTAANNPGDVGKLPLLFAEVDTVASNSGAAVELCKEVWDESELSFDFQRFPLVQRAHTSLLAIAFSEWSALNSSRISRLQALEEDNNRIFIAAYGLGEEITPGISQADTTLLQADREREGQRLVSYSIGCILGRYSLDESGLIYAHTGNVGFDPNRYVNKFPADADGILPLTDERWFEDDSTSRVRELLRAVWGIATLEENMAWLAGSLGTKVSETPEETVRRYLADKFFKDHLQTYKKRPIYWLFSSGKQGAFQALMYLHRYNEGTLARMRAEYVVPLIAKVVSRLDMLDKDVEAASSAAARTRLQKQIESLRKKQLELLAYDEKLRHYADMRITLELDDGVKVNYAKFGDLVAESKAITGGSDE